MKEKNLFKQIHPSSIVYCFKCGGREERTKQTNRIRKVFRESTIRDREIR